jgi:hypothetical protein
MRTLFALLIALALMPTAAITVSSDAAAQATCRNKCNSEEQACLKRTSNKSQCGSRAQACAAKCR